LLQIIFCAEARTRLQALRNLALLAAVAACSGGLCHGSSICGALQGLKIDDLRTWNELKAAINVVETCFDEGKADGKLSFEDQKLIIAKAGECISGIASLWSEGRERPRNGGDMARKLLQRNGAILRGVIALNSEKVRHLQEDVLDTLAETSAFFASRDWQEPQYVISLAGYWQSWNGYYSALLVLPADPQKKDLLNEATQGFARAFLDFQESEITVKSLFGRALCYKELGAGDKALLDLNSVIARIRREDPLYVRALYEKALISYTTGNYAPALAQLQEIEENVHPEMISSQVRSAMQRLKKSIVIADIEKGVATQQGAPKEFYRDALQKIARIAAADASRSDELYQFALKHAAELAECSDEELGALGRLAIADWLFSRKRYERAAAHYSRLASENIPEIKKRMDEILFRLGYCHCQQEEWQKASERFRVFFDTYPGSARRNDAACMFYAAAVQAYKQSSNDRTYEICMQAAAYYITHCKNIEGKDEARYQLGLYYKRKGQTKNAIRHFELIKKNAAHYGLARYELAQADADALDAFFRQGQLASPGAKKRYLSARANIADCKKAMTIDKVSSGTDQQCIEILILEALIYSFGSLEDGRRALGLLSDFSNKYAGDASHGHILRADIIRIESLLHLRMNQEAKSAIEDFLVRGNGQMQRWDMLAGCATRLYEATCGALRSGDAHAASDLAGRTIFLYEKLLDVAGKNSALKGFVSPLRLRLAELYAGEGNTIAAESMYEAILHQNAASADAVYNLALLYERGGRWDEALDSWRKFDRGLASGSFHWFEAKYHTSCCLGQLGKNREACELLTMIEVLYPELRDAEFKDRIMKLRRELCSPG